MGWGVPGMWGRASWFIDGEESTRQGLSQLQISMGVVG